MHLQGLDGMKMSLSMGEGDYCVIEGAISILTGYTIHETSSLTLPNP